MAIKVGITRKKLVELLISVQNFSNVSVELKL